jgi:hypothetical protein
MTNALPELDPSSTARLLMDFQHATLLAFFFIGRAFVTPTPASAIVDLGGGISKSLDDNLYRSEPGSRPTSVGFRVFANLLSNPRALFHTVTDAIDFMWQFNTPGREITPDSHWDLSRSQRGKDSAYGYRGATSAQNENVTTSGPRVNSASSPPPTSAPFQQFPFPCHK